MDMNRNSFERELDNSYGLINYKSKGEGTSHLKYIDIKLEENKFVHIYPEEGTLAFFVQCTNKDKNKTLLCVTDEYGALWNTIVYIFRYRLK